MKKKKLTKEEKTFVEAYVELYKLGIKMSSNDIKFTEERIKMWNDMLDFHMKNRPWKIFRESYKEWDKIRLDCEKHIHELYIQLEECIQDHYNLMNLPKFD